MANYLWLTRTPPYPPMVGGDIEYSRQLLHALAAHGSVQALAYADHDVSADNARDIAWSTVPVPKRARWQSLLSPLPNVANRYADQRYLAAALVLARNCSTVVVDFIAMFWCVRPLLQAMAAWPRRPTVLVVNHNFEHDVRRQMAAEERSPFRYALMLDATKAGALEASANRMADGHTAITQPDFAALARLTHRPGLVVMPGYAGTRVESRTIGPRTPRTVAIVGNYEAHHKRMVLERLLAAITARGAHKTIRIEVTGDGDSERFRSQFPAIAFVGFVPDLDTYLSNIRLGLLGDDIGGGFKLRALTHAFHRVPMLATKSALAGAGFRPDIDYREAQSVDDLARLLHAMVDDFDLLNRLQESAYDHCRTGFSWDSRGAALAAFADHLAV
jgi:hypothetical protein